MKAIICTLPQWNRHVNETTFQSDLRFQTGLGSFQVSCKRALWWSIKFPQQNINQSETAGIVRDARVTYLFVCEAVWPRLWNGKKYINTRDRPRRACHPTSKRTKCRATLWWHMSNSFLPKGDRIWPIQGQNLVSCSSIC